MSRYIFIIFISFFFTQYCFSQFLGGDGDGYNPAAYKNSISIFSGGEMDGYNPAAYKNSISIFAGGNGDGYDPAAFKNSISIFSGGNYDGHGLSIQLVSFVWTGSVGTGWNLKENWQGQVIPNINSTVIIPNTASNFPFINAGIMSIGEDPNSGAYLCKRIFILEGAEMTLRVNSFLENYGEIEIQGSMFVLNSAIDAVKNLNGALITVKPNGLFEF